MNKKVEAPPKEKEKNHIEEILMIEWGSTISSKSNKSRNAHAQRVQTSNSEVDVFHFRASKLPRFDQPTSPLLMKF